MTAQKLRAVVVGAGPTGLAAAACLAEAGVEAVILEKASTVGSAWRNHYDCLRLHTVRGRSRLPGLDFPPGTPKYPSRASFVSYLEDYADTLSLDPKLGCEVSEIRQNEGGWIVTHSQGEERGDAVIMATGLNGTPHLPDWAGDFDGPLLHSSEYRNPCDLADKRVLVVGFGNSGGDIALDLARAGAAVGVAVRGPVQILPKEILGVPVTSFGLMGRLFGPRVADRLTAPLLRLLVGRPENYGMVSADKGPATMVAEDGRVPLIDIGTLGAIREGKITVYPGIAAIEGREVCFADGGVAEFDAVIAATGYDVDLRPILGADCKALDHLGRPRISGEATAVPGLYFCSYRASADGQLRTSGIEARRIASLVAGQPA